MKIKATNKTFKSGVFVNSDGVVCVVKDFPNARMEQNNGYTSVQLCDSEGGVDWEYVWYPSTKAIQSVLDSI